MSMNKREVTEIFHSMLQPLRQAKQAHNGLSTKDLEFNRRGRITPNASFPKKIKQCTDEWLIKKYEELKRIEEKNLEMMAQIWMIFSEAGFQELFNPAERIVLKKACRFMRLYINTHKVFMENGGKDTLLSVDKIGNLYTIEYLKLQKQIILSLHELFFLSKIFKISHVSKKIENYFKKESQSMEKIGAEAGAIFDPRAFILSGREGDIVVMAVQQVNCRALVLREIIEHMNEGDEEERKLKKIYEQTEEINFFANDMMREIAKITTHINSDPFCLCEQLLEDETYEIITEIAKGEDKKIGEALKFLRDLSVLLKSDYFAMGGCEGKGVATALALKYADSSEIKTYIKLGTHVALIESLMSKAENDLKLVEPVLRQFVTSDFFVKKANLFLAEKETEEKYQSRLEKQVSNGGECIELFLLEIEERKKCKPTSPVDKTPFEPSVNNKKTSHKFISEVLGLAAPFLVLAAIPLVGIPIALTVFSILGLASFAYYMAPEKKKDRQEKTAKGLPKEERKMDRNKNVDVEDIATTPRLVNRHPSISVENAEIMGRRRQSSAVIGKRKSLYSQDEENVSDMGTERDSLTNTYKKEMKCTYGTEVTEEIAFNQYMKTSIEAKSVLNGGMWMIEDRKRRMAANDEVRMKDSVSASDKEASKSGCFSDSSEGHVSGYESFPEIEDGSDGEEGHSLRFHTHGH